MSIWNIVFAHQFLYFFLLVVHISIFSKRNSSSITRDGVCNQSFSTWSPGDENDVVLQLLLKPVPLLQFPEERDSHLFPNWKRHLVTSAHAAVGCREFDLVSAQASGFRNKER